MNGEKFFHLIIFKRRSVHPRRRLLFVSFDFHDRTTALVLKITYILGEDHLIDI